MSVSIEWLDVKQATTLQLVARVGTLSNPSKMPCYGYSIPASTCKVGGRLHLIKNSVCESCYALKGRYVFPNVKKGLKRRYNALMNDPQWEFIMVELIKRKTLTKGKTNGLFRWHDSGDIQSIQHLRKICFIAEQLPTIRFWIPTREYGIVSEYLRSNDFPPNLCVRVSAHMMDSLKGTSKFMHRSAVISSPDKLENGYICPATRPTSNHKCNDCTSCWNHSIRTINYLKH